MHLPMLTNDESDVLCRHYHVPLVSCCLNVELPNRVCYGACIINLQRARKAAAHTGQALIVAKKKAPFFDPFGAEPSHEVVGFVRKLLNPAWAAATAGRGRRIRNLRPPDCCGGA